ncbi:MAG TPA: hypothetical protein VKE70_11520, partial [Candidatus Solibacter sp.]|nr:hypothetical protein [Candidatus Solibacter sp.]
MGVVLYYKSTSPVDESVRRKIIGESTTLESRRDWWTEPLCFYSETRCPGELAGRSKINPPDQFTSREGETLAVDLRDGSFMVYADVRFIVAQLCDWSRQHGLRWTLSCDGREAGRIEGGSADEALNKFL